MTGFLVANTIIIKTAVNQDLLLCAVLFLLPADGNSDDDFSRVPVLTGTDEERA